MISELLWVLIGVQMVMGTSDKILHQELTERLAWRPSQRRKLQLHAMRNWLCAVLFAALGWTEPQGWLAIAAAGILAVVIVFTLWGFIEQELSRKPPATERVLRTLLALNYGAILVLLIPALAEWAAQPTGLATTYHGVWSWLSTVAAVGTLLFGLRDWAAARRSDRLQTPPADGLIPAMAERQTVLVTGATGFVGRRLVAALLAEGHRVIALVRDPAKGQALPTPITLVTDLAQIDSATRIDAVVNLAGEPIANFWWTAAKRERIFSSRIETTRAVIALIELLTTRPTVLINGSAIGWYGLWEDEQLDEASGFKPCFSHDLCHAWEGGAKPVKDMGVRLVLLRIGLVLGIEGGVLSRMLTPFEFCLGGPLGSGRQWMSWIERDDLVRLIGHALAHDCVKGRLNGTAPHPVTNAEFSLSLGAAVGRPALARMPVWLLRRLGGQMAEELLLNGQRVVPLKSLACGFTFRHATLDEAFAHLLGRPHQAGQGGDAVPLPANPLTRPGRTATLSSTRSIPGDA